MYGQKSVLFPISCFAAICFLLLSIRLFSPNDIRRNIDCGLFMVLSISNVVVCYRISKKNFVYFSKDQLIVMEKGSEMHIPWPQVKLVGVHRVLHWKKITFICLIDDGGESKHKVFSIQYKKKKIEYLRSLSIDIVNRLS